MPRFQIKLNDRGKDEVDKGNAAISMHDYDFLIDGYELPMLRRVDLSFDVEEYPEATMTFLASDLEIDAETINAMKVMIEQQENKDYSS